MIVTSQDDWVALYTSIKEESRKSDEKFVFIYASAQDCDSICALRILERLLKNDRIPHGFLPVTRYEEITEDFVKYYTTDETAMRTAILINCGAAEDVRQLLELEQRPNVRVIIIDSHRPICHTANLDDGTDSVHVFLDEGEGCNKEDIPPYLGPYGEAGSEDEGTSDRENDEGNMQPSQRRRLGSPSSSNEGPSRYSSGRAHRRKEREQQEELRKQYYSKGVWFGKPAACIMYDLAYFLQMNNSHMLWLALVGLTDHLVHFRITGQKYNDYYFHYESQVSSSGHLDVQLERDIGDGTTVVNNITCRIFPQEEFRFGLLWEWNLYEAMMYSPYVASRLQTYHEKGKALLETLLAKAGIPLHQSKLSFIQDMRPQFRHSLHQRLSSHAAAFKMSDLTFNSFQLQDGPKRCVSAVDAVHAVSALLHSSSKRGGGDLTAKEHLDKFERGYRALSWGDDLGELHKGLELAKRLQKAVVMDGGAVIAQKLFNNFKQFRIFDLSDHKVNNQHLLSHPMALQRLAAFFQEQHYHSTGKRKPIILVGPKSGEGRCMVIGFEATSRMQGNKLGQAFAEATELVGAQSWHDLFDTAVIEVAAGDVERFKSELLRVAFELL